MGRVSDAKQRLMDAVLELIWCGSYGSTTIDLICEKAGVKKGSFYYFFRSKADLAVAAVEASWDERRPQLEAVFSPALPPLERIRRFCESSYERQVELKKKYGRVLGCPMFTFGAEVCTQERKLRAKIQEILDQYRRYLETAIREAQSAGLVKVSDTARMARIVFMYFEGALTQARIQNDVEQLREVPEAVFEILGVAAGGERAAA